MLLPGMDGKENRKACIAYCGSRNYAYGGIDEDTTDYDCFCGNTIKESCDVLPCLLVRFILLLLTSAETFANFVNLGVFAKVYYALF